MIRLEPYRWQGPYSEWRANAPHDPGLCADARARWMNADERLILRSCEMIGDPEFYLYDDHIPPADPDGRGRSYRHIPFVFDKSAASRELSANCDVPGKGRFGITLTAGDDHIDIRLTVANHLSRPM